MARWSRIAPYIPFAIVLVGVLAYLNTFTNPFIFDDARIITDNRGIDRLFPIFFSTRWLVDFTFRLNYAMAGFSVPDYHAFNLGVHLATALLLFGVIRRTLALPRLRERWGAPAVWIAGAVAMLFVVHPLQTASVTYICQRYEAMMAMLFLATLYSTIRALTASRRGWRVGWAMAAVGCCLLGMGTKEVMLTAPLVVLLYDWIFVGRSLPGTGRLRVGLHVGLFLTLGVLVAMELRMLDLMAAGGQSLTSNASPWIYLATQTEVILHYLRLSVWPTGQCLDYAWPMAAGWGAVWPAALLIVGVGLLSLWGLLRRTGWGFLGGCFFLVLGPSSSLLPAPDAAFEHRMYLPLAAVLTAIVLTGYRLFHTRLRPARRAPLIWLVILIGVTAALATATHQRNRAYASRETMWRDVMAKQPGNYRQRLALSYALFDRGADREAEEVIRNLIADTKDGFNRKQSSLVTARDPFWHHAVARGQLGRMLLRRGDASGAVEHIAVTLLALPEDAVAHHNMALALGALHRYRESLRAARNAVEFDPRYGNGYGTLAFLLARRGAYTEAATNYRKAIALSSPSHSALRLELAWLLATTPEDALRDGAEAERLAMEVFTATGERSIRALDALAAALAEQGQYGDALIRIGQALSLVAETGSAAASAAPVSPSGLSGWGPAADRATLVRHRRRYATRQPFRSEPGGGRE
ncbi:MAG: tetratricopeptide repeat protein [Verrucomicrobia bacterium]|jgi:protein O-mannosyl-transferase|nr:tetratricopeptide repeat protein [Verrucomicrobiota bacterium]MBT7066312.1 tetratricopeptide repeat protein [Verrucomicrobiota bacterium]MBT7699270.1 tetratricopeptide repeat protein [Verrucomicrobiota bacterium]